MRAIKIDAVKKEIYEVEIRGDNKSMYKELDSEGVEGVRLSKTERVWIDDVGLHRNPPLGAFQIKWYPQALSGHGLILGLRGPENTSTKLTLEEVRDIVQFVDVSELPLPVITTVSFETFDDFLKDMQDDEE